MKTDWRAKLKNVLSETIAAKKSEICLKMELTKTDETISNRVLSPFVSGELKDISENQSFSIKEMSEIDQF